MDFPSSTRDANQNFIKLAVDCTDPYGRLDVDADGHGGNTTDASLARSSTEDAKPSGKSAISPRKATVFVCNDASSPYPISISVLSASISSSKRIRKDKESAMSIARALDIERRIPVGSRIDDLIDKVVQLRSSLSSI